MIKVLLPCFTSMFPCHGNIKHCFDPLMNGILPCFACIILCNSDIKQSFDPMVNFLLRDGSLKLRIFKGKSLNSAINWREWSMSMWNMESSRGCLKFSFEIVYSGDEYLESSSYSASDRKYFILVSYWYHKLCLKMFRNLQGLFARETICLCKNNFGFTVPKA